MIPRDRRSLQKGTTSLKSPWLKEIEGDLTRATLNKDPSPSADNGHNLQTIARLEVSVLPKLTM